MATIQSYLLQSELALAAYASLFSGIAGDNFRAALAAGGFASDQRRLFSEQWRVIDQYNHVSDPYPVFDEQTGDLVRYDTTTNGLSVTVFEEVATSKRFLAIRGTDDSYDLVTDLVSISILGTTKFQGQYQSLRQKVLEWMGNGTLPSSYTVTGHSLGGFLTTGLQLDLPGAIEHVYLFNSPGIDGIAATQFVGKLLRTFQIDDRAIDPTKFSNIRAAAGVSPISGLGIPVSAPIKIEIENQFFSDVPSPAASRNHSQQVLTDSLAVYATLAHIGSNLSIEQIGTIIRAASNRNVTTMENVVNSLAKVIGFPGASIENRDQLYAAMQAVAGDSRLRFASVSNLVEMSQDEIRTRAQAANGLAYRYALKELNPFAVLGPDTLYVAHNQNGELDQFDVATGAGQITTAYVRDRVEMLSWNLARNRGDLGIVPDSSGTPRNYVDYRVVNTLVDGTPTASIVKDTVSVGGGIARRGLQQIAFGSDMSDTLLGFGNADRLYGGGGGDSLNGLGGNDYLEGGIGADKIDGGFGDDTLVGGADDDMLRGGAGEDIYRFQRDGGHDTVADTREVPGQVTPGQLLFDDEQVVGVAIASGTSGRIFTIDGSQGGSYTLTLTGDAQNQAGGILNIFRAGDPSVVTVLDFRSGDFGIVLGDVAPVAKTDLNGTSNSDNSFSTQPGHGSTLIADAPNQKVFGLDGNDRIIVAQVGAEAYGGAGDDYITNDTGDQALYGEDGNDILIASGGNDTLDGGTGNDALQGGEDNDVLKGGDGDDAIDGGAGSDAISGGGGNDFILGGGSIVPTIGQGELDDPAARPFGVFYQNDVFGLQNMTGFLFVAGDGANSIDAGAGNDTVLGGEAEDFVDGGTGNDLLAGFAGQDTVYGGEGNDNIYGDVTQGGFTVGGNPVYALPEFHAADYLDGGDGDDFITADGGADELIGGAGDDTLVGDAAGLDEQYHGADYLDGGDGADKLYGNGKDDTLFGGAGNDTLEGDSNDTPFAKHGNDYLDGEAGDDKLQGDGGADTLFGGDGADQLFGDSDDTPVANQGDDYLDGEAGDDYLRAYGGNDTLYGGDGADQMLGEAGIDYLDGEAGNDLISGGEGDDTLIGGLGVDDLHGDAGNDSLDGGEANDLLAGGDGDDSLSGGEGSDQLAGDAGKDTLSGGAGNDNFFAGAGDDTIYGGDGIDQGLGGEGNDAIYGEAGDDAFLGEAGDDRFSGGDGVDQFDGGAGNDVIAGDAGDDTLVGGIGNDRISGGEGIDAIAGGDGEDVLAGDAGVDTLQGGADDDQLSGGEGDDTLFGDAGNDRMLGDAGEDWLQGGAGADFLSGLSGQDTLLGQDGDDQLFGGLGFDLLQGGTGDDELSGGLDVDRYFYNPGDGVDTITDSGHNILSLDYFYSPSVLRLGLGSLLLDFGGGDAIHLAGFDPEDAAGTSPIDTFEFQNATLTLDELLAQGFDFDGTPDADVLTGTPFDDRINALEDDDVVQALGGNDIVDGGAGDDQLYGDAGDDALYGGEGADTLAGGEGDDVYEIDYALDTIVENADEGYDRIDASISATIAENVEELRLTGPDDLSGTGNAIGNVLKGNSGDNALYGLEGNDQLQGGFGDDVMDGGAGADAMFGSIGDDTYIVDDAGDTVADAEDFYDRRMFPDAFGSWGTQVESGGYDTVLSSVSFALGQFVEDLVLTGTDAINGTGTVEANTLQGNDAANALYGHRADGEVDPFPTGVPFIQQFLPFPLFSPAHEMVFERANVEVFRGRTQWFVPLNVDLEPGEGDEMLGMGGDDRLYGTLDNDYLEGGEGDDLLNGFAGSDFMVGGSGDDTYVVSGDYAFYFAFAGGEHASYSDAGAHWDELIEQEDEGIDTVVSEIDFALGENFENLTLVIDTRDYDAGPGLSYSPDRGPRNYALFGEGNELDNVITGNQLDNELYGNEGEDTLYGGEGFDYLDGGEGADRMEGQGGSDTYVVDDAGDLVVESGAPDVDEVFSSIDYTLTANVESLYLEGETFAENLTGTGNELHNLIVGNDGDNALSGLAGNDVLDGGEGDDVMTGGENDDTYYVDSDFDETTEAFDEGHDTVVASISHTLGDNLEDLYLTGENDDYGEGNALDNLIVGDVTGNYLGGFEGSDTLLGREGDDELYGDEGDDAISGDEGFDYLEGGEGNDFLDGGADGDELLGGSGNDELQGGTGGDWMEGGAGDDVYYVDSDWDTVDEAFDAGVDTVYEENIFYYSIPQHVENATVIGDYSELGEDDGTAYVWGNEIDNVIIGNDGWNYLQGLDGADTIDGRAGNDQLSGDAAGDVLYGGDDALRARVIYLDSYGEEVPFWWDDAKPAFTGEFELAQNSDRIEGGAGDDDIDGGSGDDALFGDDDRDVLYGGDDGLIGDAVGEGGGGGEGDEEEVEVGIGETEDGRFFLRNRDTLSGGEGDDVIDGGSDDDELYGGEGDDELYGGGDGPLNLSNDDLLDGGTGIDFMAGGTGDDLYVVDGTYEDTTGTVIDDCGEPIFDAPIRQWTTDLVIENEDEGYDRVFAYADYTLAENVEELQLASFDYFGTTTLRFGRGNEGGNWIFGNAFDNRLEGAGGDDTLYGNDGDDVLDGGAGNDTLIGGAGDDIYNLGAGGGHDLVAGSGSGFDAVHVIQDIAAADIVVTRQRDDVVLGVAGTGDRITLANWFNDEDGVLAVEFCDDDAWDAGMIEDFADARVDPIAAFDDAASVAEDGVLVASGNVLGNDTNDDPIGALRVSAPGTLAGAYGTLALAENGSYVYTLDNGSDAVQSLAAGEVAFDSFRYEASDLSGAYASALLEIEIAGANDAPQLGAGGTGAVLEDAGELDRFTDENLLRDGGLEDPFGYWTVEGNTDYAGTDFLAEDGRAFFSGAIGTPTLLAQDVETFAGERYLLEFYLYGGESAGAGVAEFGVSWNGETVLAVTDTGLADEYRRYQVVLEGAHDESRIEFSLRNDPGFWHLDEVSLGLLEEEFIPDDFHEAGGELLFTDIDATDGHWLDDEERGGDYLGSFDAFIDDDSFYGQTGVVAWEFFVDNEELQFLSEGETLEQTYDLTLYDPWGGNAVQSVTVMLTGVNDEPEHEDTVNYVAEDDVLTAEGNVLDNVFDVDESDVLAVATPGSYAGDYGTLELFTDGSYLYTLDNDSEAVQALASGDAVEDAFELEVTDGHVTLLPMIFIGIDGTNDIPVAAADAADVQEDGILEAAGNVLANDSDVDANTVLELLTTGTLTGGYGTLELNQDGSYLYTLDNATVQSLAEGETVTDTFAYEASDGLESGFGALTVTVTGANDTPEAEDIFGLAEENGPAITLTAVFGDVDFADAHTVAVVAYGNAGFEQGDFGGWTLQDASLGRVIENGAPIGERHAELRAGGTQGIYGTLSRAFALQAGESLSGLAEFIAGDALPYDDDAYVTVRRLGGESVTLFAASVTTVGDYGDTGWMPFEFIAAEAGTYVLEAGVRNSGDGTADSRLLLDGAALLRPAQGVTAHVDGSFDYDPGGRFEWLAEGEVATDLLTITVTDDHGATGFATATVEILGANDGPAIGTADLAATVTEDNSLPAAGALGAIGSVAFSDVDLSDVHEVQVGTLDSGYLGEFSATLIADSTGGAAGSLQWSYALENGALDYLGAGQTLAQSYEVLVADAFGGTDARIVTVTLAGVNDGPVAVNEAASVQEDGILEATGSVLGNDSDADLSDVLQVAMPGTFFGAYGTLTLAADGTYSYLLDNAAAQALAAGEHFTESFGYRATDGTAFADATLRIDVAGTNDLPVTGDDSASVQEDVSLTASGNVLANDSDIDGATTLTVANAGLYGSLDLSANGDYTYTLDNASAAVQALRAGQSVTDVFGYAATDGIASTTGSLVVTIEGTNDDPLAGNDSGAAQEDGPAVTLLASTLLANDTDADLGDTKTITAVTNSVAGAQVTLMDGNAVYSVGGLFQTLRAGATASDSFTYAMVDGAGAASTGTVTMTITGVNDAPVLAVPIADQNASAGTPFSFIFGAGTFTDIDAGDVLSYAATQGDGSALPSWLTFDPATRTFAGTPPGTPGSGGGGTGGTGDDCGCGTGGGTAPATLDLRVTATDTAGASAQDAFVLNIAGGGSGIVPIVGTDRDDVIAGTDGDDVIDGRRGYDRMSGGAGDDVYYVDRTGSKVDLVTESAASGYDTVYSSANYTLGSDLEELHLIGDDDLEGRGNSLANMLIGNAGDSRLYGEAGDDLLLDDAGEDRLDGGAGDDVMDGGAGDDALSGGAGNDLYVHAKGGGDDVVLDSGGTDAIRFGAGISASNVAVRRNHNDLTLRLTGGNGSVTVKDWFSSSTKRVEQVQFADGTTWDEAAIRARVRSGSGGSGGHGGDWNGCGSDGHAGPGGRGNGHDRDDDGWDGHHGGRHGHKDHHGGGRGPVEYRDVIGERLKRNPNYDFTALAQYLQRNGGGGYGAMTPQQIAQRWLQVQNCVASLAQADDHDGHGSHGGSHLDGGCGSSEGHANGGWGYWGSTGRSPRCGGMDGFSGLVEGFRRL